MSIKQFHRAVCLIIFLVVLVISIVGCTSPTPTVQRLRVTNSGKIAITNLSILFPEDDIHFGNISPSTTTDYQDIPNGIYGYAAYRFELDGQMVIQPVTDWVGEVPLDGDTFTYVINFNSNRNQGEMVKLLEVKKDE